MNQEDELASPEYRIGQLEAYKQYLRKALANIMKEKNQNDVEYMYLKNQARHTTQNSQPPQDTTGSQEKTIKILSNVPISLSKAAVKEALSNDDNTRMVNTDVPYLIDQELSLDMELDLDEWCSY